MSATCKGKATVEGILGAILYPAIVSAGQLEIMSGEVTDAADVQKRLDGNGEVKGYRARQKRKEFSIDCYATIASGTARADATKAVILPPIPSKVALSSFEEATGAGINGDYVYEGGGKIVFGDDFAKITLPLVKYEATAADTLVATIT